MATKKQAVDAADDKAGKRSGSNWLSDLQCRAAKEGVHGDGGGLYLQVQARKDGAGAVTRSWVFRFTSPATGKARWLGLGKYGAGEGDVGLQAARELRDAARRQVREGIDPIEARKAVRAERVQEAQQQADAGRTLRTVAELVIEATVGTLSNEKHKWTWRQTIEKYIYPKLGDRPIAEVGVEDVLDVLRPLVDSDKLETARRTRGRAEKVFDFAAARGWYEKANPWRMRGHLELLVPALIKRAAEVEHYEALHYRDVGAFMVKLRAVPGVSARCLEFVVLTASRGGEARGARWNEIDWHAEGGPVWRVPGSRMKRRVEHSVPLSAAVVAVLEGLGVKEDDSLIFPSVRKDKAPLSNMALLALVRRMKAACVPHGFRASFSTWGNEVSGFPADAIEVSLAHLTGSAVSRSYSRGDLLEKRRALMETWANYIAKPTEKARVTALQKVAA